MFWVIAAGCYCFFIALLSCWYPYTIDELVLPHLSLSDILAALGQIYDTMGGRIGFVPYIFILYAGKWLFVILNPFVQLFLVWLIFYLIYMRGPDIKKFDDFWTFILLMLMSVFASAQPDQTMFWIGGAASYSWAFIPFIFALILLRKFLRGDIFRNVWYIKVLLFACGLIFGLTNENNGPALLTLFICAAVYLKIKKAVLPASFYFILAGILGGLVLMFLAPAYKMRMQNISGQVLSDAGFLKNIFWHLAHFHYMIGINFYLLPVTALFLLLFVLDNGAKIFKNEDFLFSFLCLAVSFLLFMPLAFIPSKGRLLYSAVWMSGISFVFLLKFAERYFKLLFTKWCALFAFACALPFVPSFMFPYYDLHRQECARNAVIEEATNKKNPFVFVSHFRAAQGPNKNLSIDSSFEPMFRSSVTSRRELYKTELLIFSDARN